MKTLLHICCAPCSIACIRQLREEGIEPTGFWYNPNIHPMLEYKTRKNTLVEYAKSIDLQLILENEYGLRTFVEAVCPNFNERCGYCYRVRMEETARRAAELGFSSTGTSGRASARARTPPASWGCTCRSTAAACSARRTGTPSERRKSRRNKTKFSRFPKSGKRLNCFTPSFHP